MKFHSRVEIANKGDDGLIYAILFSFRKFRYEFIVLAYFRIFILFMPHDSLFIIVYRLCPGNEPRDSEEFDQVSGRASE